MKNIQSLSLLLVLIPATHMFSSHHGLELDRLRAQFQLLRTTPSFYTWTWLTDQKNSKSSNAEDRRYTLFKQRYQLLAAAGMLGYKPSDVFSGSNETKRGMYLTLNGLYGKDLFTPWGHTTLAENNPLNANRDIDTTAFFNTISFSFMGNDCTKVGWEDLTIHEEKVAFYRINPYTAQRATLSEDEVLNLVGSKAIISTNNCKCRSYYEVRGVNKKPIAEKLDLYPVEYCDGRFLPDWDLRPLEAIQAEEVTLFKRALADIEKSK